LREWNQVAGNRAHFSGMLTQSHGNQVPGVLSLAMLQSSNVFENDQMLYK